MEWTMAPGQLGFHHHLRLQIRRWRAWSAPRTTIEPMTQKYSAVIWASERFTPSSRWSADSERAESLERTSGHDRVPILMMTKNKKDNKKKKKTQLKRAVGKVNSFACSNSWQTSVEERRVYYCVAYSMQMHCSSLWTLQCWGKWKKCEASDAKIIRNSFNAYKKIKNILVLLYTYIREQNSMHLKKNRTPYARHREVEYMVKKYDKGSRWWPE